MTKRSILNAGIYDLCHRGHIALLRRMREAAGPDGRLVVVLHDDRSCFEIKGKIPVQQFEHRMENLRIVGLTDLIVPCFTADPAEYFAEAVRKERELGYEVTYMRGDDLTGDFPGRWKLDELGVPVQLLKYTEGVSSSLIRKELEQQA